jgi:hypothetical protein
MDVADHYPLKAPRGQQDGTPTGSSIACWLKELAGMKAKSKIGGAIEFEEEFVW